MDKTALFFAILPGEVQRFLAYRLQPVRRTECDDTGYLMKCKIFSFVVFIPLLFVCENILAAPPVITSHAGGSIGFFFSALAPHGEWIEVPSGMQVWRPIHVPIHWRPYLLGRWVWTDDGWYWLSSESFGWVTYHYGRWYDDEYYGWIWLPDDVWAPAWVEWRYDDDFIGWAPLPPYATFYWAFGIRFTTEWNAPVHYWNFIRYRDFGTNLHYGDMVTEAYARHLMHSSQAGWDYGVENGRIINHGIDRRLIEYRGNLHFEQTEIRAIHEHTGERMNRSTNNRRPGFIEVYRLTDEELHRNSERVEAHLGERTLSLDMAKLKPRSIGTIRRDESHPIRDESLKDRSGRPSNVYGGTRQERSIREHLPRVQPRPSQSDRVKLRQDLIQRHEFKPRPSLPSVRERNKQRLERGKEISRSTHPDNSLREPQRDDDNHRRK